MMFDADERILVFPVDRESISFIKSTANYPNIRIRHIISPESWGYGGEIYMCAGGAVKIHHDFENGLSDCTVVWIVDSWNEIDFKEFIKPVIHLAASKNKRVICSRSLAKNEKELISNIEINYIKHSSIKPLVKSSDRIYEIETPIIYVMSSTDFCNQLYIETALCAELQNRGYNALLLSSRKEFSAFGGHTIPDFMFLNELSENEKVIAINHYIHQLEIKLRPEVIIIGIPGAAMPFNPIRSSDFGLLANEISEAVKPDFAILSSPCLLYDDAFFKRVEDSLYGRLGVSIDVHSLSLYALDILAEKNDLSFISVDNSFVDNIIKQIGYKNLINMNDIAGISDTVDRLIIKFSNETSSLIT